MIYDKFAENYDKAFAPFEKRFLSKWREETLSHLPENAKILEIGHKTNEIKFVQADAETLPFAANSFDAAFATLVFCSIPKPENAFAELRRIIKPNGKIILLEHVRPNGLLGFTFDFLNILTVALIEDHFNRQTAKLAEQSGLEVLEVKQKAFGIVNLIVCENK
jgi:SAM-dependent methyltransferase